MNNLCENATKFNDGRHKYLLCSQTTSVCCFYRYCNNDNCFKMLSNYKNKCILLRKKEE